MDAELIQKVRRILKKSGRYDSVTLHMSLFEEIFAALSATPQAAQAKCATCNGVGLIGGNIGQTAESFDYVDEPCPDCQQAPQAAQVPAAVVREYLEARDAVEDAQRPPNSHAMPARLNHSDPRALRYREARGALSLAVARPQAAQVPEGDSELRLAAGRLFFAAINIELMAEFRERFPRKHARLREAIEGIRPLLAAAQAQGVGRG